MTKPAGEPSRPHSLAVPYLARERLHARGWMAGLFGHTGAPVDDPGARVTPPAGVRRHGPAGIALAVHDPARIALRMPYRAREALHARGWTLDPFGHLGRAGDAVHSDPPARPYAPGLTIPRAPESSTGGFRA